jgi:ATP-dependent protease ClpP protease subunit
MAMIKDWKTFREMALEYAKRGFIPVYGEFCMELEEVVLECIFFTQIQGMKSVTLLINSNGGSNDCFTAIRAAMLLSGIEFTGFVMARAISNGFRLLQTCKIRKALANSGLMFHWGSYRLMNNELSAIMSNRDWTLEHVRNGLLTTLQEISDRTGVPTKTLCQYALFERDFTADEALTINFVDEVAKEPPISTQQLDEQLDTRETIK